jgi:hypothetical protein
MTHTERALQLRPILEMAAQSLEDSIALTAVEFFPNWEKLVKDAAEVKKGFRFQYMNKLYRVEQPVYVFVEHYIPGSVGTESIFSIVDESHSGSVNDPIHYEINMEIYNGLYYIENDIIYLCIRDSGIALQHNLSSLIGVYVEKV